MRQPRSGTGRVTPTRDNLVRKEYDIPHSVTTPALSISGGSKPPPYISNLFVRMGFSPSATIIAGRIALLDLRISVGFNLALLRGNHRSLTLRIFTVWEY